MGKAARLELVETGLPPGREHCYTVRAVDGAGNPSRPSEPACAVTLDVTPPAPPPAVRAQPVNETSITLTWGVPTDDVGVVGYELWRDANLVARPAGTTATIDGFTAATRACFTVVALDKAGNRSGASAAGLRHHPRPDATHRAAAAHRPRRERSPHRARLAAGQRQRRGHGLPGGAGRKGPRHRPGAAVGRREGRARRPRLLRGPRPGRRRQQVEAGQRGLRHATGPDAAHHPGQPGRPGALLRHRRARVEPVPRRRGRDRLRGGAQGSQALPRGQAAGDRRRAGARDRVLPPGPCASMPRATVRS